MSGSSISKLVPNDRNPNFCTIHLGAVSFSGPPPPYRRSRPVQEASLGPGHSFVDVGSGLGKLVVAAACVTPDEVPCSGVEISPFRWGLQIGSKLHSRTKQIFHGGTLIFLAPLSGAIFSRPDFLRHQTAQEGLQGLQSMGSITRREARPRERFFGTAGIGVELSW